MSEKHPVIKILNGVLFVGMIVIGAIVMLLDGALEVLFNWLGDKE